MKKVLLGSAIVTSLLAGCASVPMESDEASTLAKQFSAPSDGKAGIYIYRSGGMGTALKKDVWINDECVGETAPNMFFYKVVNSGDEIKVSTESEFSPNDLLVKAESGKNYFVEQYIKMGVFVGGADLELVSQTDGQRAIEKLKLAKAGNCSK